MNRSSEEAWNHVVRLITAETDFQDTFTDAWSWMFTQLLFYAWENAFLIFV